MRSQPSVLCLSHDNISGCKAMWTDLCAHDLQYRLVPGQFEIGLPL